MKICGKCKVEKPLSEFHKDLRSKDELQFKCKSCVSEHYKANKEVRAAYLAEYYANNRAHLTAKQSAYQATNKDRVAAYKVEYRLANKERIAAKKAQHYSANRERVAARHAEYRAANPEIFAANNRNRRAMKRNAEGRHTAADVARIFESQRGLCANCHAKLFKSGKNKFHADHIIPLAKGGSNWPHNIQCLCPRCNTSKQSKDPFEWAKQNGRLL